MKDELFIVESNGKTNSTRVAEEPPHPNSVGGARGELTVKSDFPAFVTTEAAATSVCESREAETLPRVHGVSPEPGWQSWQKLSSGLHLAPFLLPLAPPSPRMLLLSRDGICWKRPFPSSRLPKPVRAALRSARPGRRQVRKRSLQAADGERGTGREKTVPVTSASRFLLMVKESKDSKDFGVSGEDKCDEVGAQVEAKSKKDNKGGLEKTV